MRPVLWAWIGLAAAGTVAEAHAGSLAGAAIAVSAALAGALDALTAAPPVTQAAVFAASSVVLLAFVRPLVARQRVRPVHAPEMLVGKLGTVCDPVDEQFASGRVQVEGVPYVARSTPGCGRLALGTGIRVDGVDCGELVVSRL